VTPIDNPAKLGLENKQTKNCSFNQKIALQVANFESSKTCSKTKPFFLQTKNVAFNFAFENNDLKFPHVSVPGTI
jgi:hypothetical protein